MLFVAALLGSISIQHLWITWPERPNGDGADLGPASQPLRSYSSYQLARKTAEPPLSYARRITNIVHLSTFHCMSNEYQLSIIDRVVVRYLGYEQMFDEGILSRHRINCGLCHQRAAVVAEILNNNGIKSTVFGLNGHVVARLETSDGVFLTDPDYGVGPYEYVNDKDELYKSVLIQYRGSAWDNAENVAMYASSFGDNREYYNHIYEAQTAQDVIFKMSSMLAKIILSFSVILCVIPAAFYIHQRRNILRDSAVGTSR